MHGVLVACPLVREAKVADLDSRWPNYAILQQSVVQLQVPAGANTSTVSFIIMLYSMICVEGLIRAMGCALHAVRSLCREHRLDVLAPISVCDMLVNHQTAAANISFVHIMLQQTCPAAKPSATTKQEPSTDLWATLCLWQ